MRRELIDKATSRFRVQKQAAGHYRFPFDAGAWFEAFCREYDLSEDERKEFALRLMAGSLTGSLNGIHG